MKEKERLLTDRYFETYLEAMDVDLSILFQSIEEIEWSLEKFIFFTAVSVMTSSRIEGEPMEVDSYVKHIMQDITFEPNLTDRPNDLFASYIVARQTPLTKENIYTAHTIATSHLLPMLRRGQIRQTEMVIVDQVSGRIQYEAISAKKVKREYNLLWKEINELIDRNLSIPEVFYYASLIHLVFVKIHPFDDGNGRMARLLEKWFLVTKLGEKAWYIRSESYYYQHLVDYYQHLAVVGLFYEDLVYEKSIPFLLMLPKSLTSF